MFGNQHEDLLDLSMRIIDRHIDREKNQCLHTSPDDVDVIMDLFVANYTRASSVPAYVKFDTCGDRGIPRLVRYFQTFDPMNAVGSFDKWTDFSTTPTDLEMRHVHDYMTAKEFNKELLRTDRYDRVVYAICSFMATWTNEALIKYGDRYKDFKQIALLIVTERERAPVYVVPQDGVPFLRSSFRILSRYFNSVERQQQKVHKVEYPTFSVTRYVSSDLVAHFKEVYQWLLDESMTQHEIAMLEKPMASPFALCADYSGAGNNNTPMKVITGQACCGKTTLLDRLKKYGWQVCSRGDLGTFSGKSKSAPAIAGLHAALENALHRGDVLGDRGPIDNPLWTIIMTLCDPQYKDRVVEELLKFFNATINEHVIAYMLRQEVVVFIDPYPSLNRARMMSRCTGGDAYRARIRMYPITQCIAYYMAARLYGWTVRCVPYDEERNFQPQRYRAMAEEIKNIFGTPLKQGPLRLARKPDGHYLEDTEYSIATGIFK